MSALHALLLGIVEGITEFLPISSTGHLILTSKLLGLPDSEFLKSFNIAIQLGAILSVCVLYWRTLLLSRETFLKVCAAFLPTAVIGFAAHGLAKEYLLDSAGTVLWSLFIGGIVLIGFEMWYERRHVIVRRAHHDDASDATLSSPKGDITTISYAQAALLGVFQAIAIIPGVSRSGATIIGGLTMGLSRRTIVDFSFLLAIPTMAAATALDLLKSYDQFTADDAVNLGIGFVVSFFVALLSIKWLLGYIKHHSFKAFGVYRIAVAVVFGGLFWLGVL